MTDVPSHSERRAERPNLMLNVVGVDVLMDLRKLRDSVRVRLQPAYAASFRYAGRDR